MLFHVEHLTYSLPLLAYILASPVLIGINLLSIFFRRRACFLPSGSREVLSLFLLTDYLLLLLVASN